MCKLPDNYICKNEIIKVLSCASACLPSRRWLLSAPSTHQNTPRPCLVFECYPRRAPVQSDLGLCMHKLTWHVHNPTMRMQSYYDDLKAALPKHEEWSKGATSFYSGK
jgi:hypothetical protein